MLVFVVLGVTFFLFFSIHLVPGDPARAFLGQEATPASIAALHNQWGLNLPIPEQYWLYLDRLVHLNLGTSLYYQSGVVGLVAGRIPVTLLLLLYGVTGAVLISVPLALLAAVNQGRLADHVVRGLGTVGLGMPSFWNSPHRRFRSQGARLPGLWLRIDVAGAFLVARSAWVHDRSIDRPNAHSKPPNEDDRDSPLRLRSIRMVKRSNFDVRATALWPPERFY